MRATRWGKRRGGLNGASKPFSPSVFCDHSQTIILLHESRREGLGWGCRIAGHPPPRGIRSRTTINNAASPSAAAAAVAATASCCYNLLSSPVLWVEDGSDRSRGLNLTNLTLLRQLLLHVCQKRWKYSGIRCRQNTSSKIICKLKALCKVHRFRIHV